MTHIYSIPFSLVVNKEIWYSMYSSLLKPLYCRLYSNEKRLTILSNLVVLGTSVWLLIQLFYQRVGLVLSLRGLQDAALGDPGSNPGSR